MIMNNDSIEQELKIKQEEIDKNQKELDILLEQRAEIIVKASMNGVSKIDIADMLDVTRQRIYAIIDNKRLKEEE
tara:strand:- start:500 stop:724 length:225 start_codon:yes stop_codon:yes gene_type:complete